MNALLRLGIIKDKRTDTTTGKSTPGNNFQNTLIWENNYSAPICHMPYTMITDDDHMMVIYDDHIR